ncbi:MAG: hypothetical protein OIN87_08810 [Candidatus Methanoperedens sp.]|nr:hypothetical protein [Candidatus Methanoperedens sp.]
MIREKILRIISISFGISAIILISLAIASPNGITFYEDRMYIKSIEILFSTLAVIYMLRDLKTTIKGI